MEFNILNKARRSINFFDPNKTVPLSLLEDMISLAAHAPSSFNLQPWNLMVVSDARDKARLRKLAWDQPKVTEAPVTLIILGDRSGWKEGHPTLEKHWKIATESGSMTDDQREWFINATQNLYGRSDEASLAFAAKNAGFFAMALMYAATHLGLCSHPMDGFDHDAVAKEFNIPKHHWIPLLLAVGYMKPDMELSPPKWRKGLDELIVKF
ncbi:MAG: nitroreductase family protein [Desulfobacterales bacterium]|nr:nitroreductase family protein [Desulfobacterales bacterium]